MYDTDEYAEIQAVMEANVQAWLEHVGTAEVPDTSGERDAWSEHGGVSPWLTDPAPARDLPSLYDYAAAPNIVFLLADDWGANDIGYQSSYMNWATPNIDKLAANGVKLTNYFTNNLCTPSRASLMTGRYALRFGMNGASDEAELPTSEMTMAEELKTAGYRTYLVGKWHLGWSSEEKLPNNRGFDYFYGFLGGHIDYYTKYFMGTNLDLNENGILVTDESELDDTLHSAFLFQSKVEDVIASHAANHQDEPMFLYYAAQLVHADWAAPKSYQARCTGPDDITENQKTYLTYCAMNLMLDEVLANVTCALERHNMAQNTVVIMVSDNGGYAAMPGNNYPYRGSKGTLTRGGDSVPGFVYAPTTLMPDAVRGTSYEGQMHVTGKFEILKISKLRLILSNSDWLPTIMGLATGGAWTGSYLGNTIDGVDMWTALTTNTASPRSEIVHYLTSDGNCSYQLDMVKLIMTDNDLDGVTLPSFAIDGDSASPSVCLV